MSVVTQHSVVKRGGLYWDRALLPQQMYARRIELLQARMAAAGDDAWLMFGDVQNHGPVVWATNFMPRVRSALAYVPRQGAPSLFANISTRDIPAAKTITWVDDIQAFQRLPKSLGDFIGERHPGGAQIGHCGIDQSMPVTDWRAIEQALASCKLAARDRDFQGLREVKDQCEVAAIGKSAGFADLALTEAASRIQAGRSLRAVIAELDRAVRCQGAEDVRFLVAAGADAGVALAPVSDRVLAAGDTVLIYVAVQNQRYWAEAARTYFIGTADPALLELHSRAQQALDAMTASARPATQIGSIAGSARAALGEAASAAGRYGYGNAIGLDADEAPVISGASGGRLVEGSTLALRVITHAGGRGVALARTVHVTAQGAVALGSGDTSLAAVGT